MRELRTHLAGAASSPAGWTRSSGPRATASWARSRTTAGSRRWRASACCTPSTAGDVLYIDDLSTMAEARGRGHAGALIDSCAEEGRRLGCHALQLDSGVGPGAPGRAPPVLPQAAPDRVVPLRAPAVASRPCPRPPTPSAAHPCYERHERAGARLVPFAGWEMPVQYEGIRAGARRRAHAGGHVRRLAHGRDRDHAAPGAEAFLQHLLSNDVTKIAERGAQYSVLCREDGGVLDDLFTYRLETDRFLTVTNASNHEKDLAWFREPRRRRSTPRSWTPRRRLGDARRPGPRCARGMLRGT